MIHQIDENKKVIDVISIMPEYFESFLKAGLIGRALKTGLMEINIINPRDFSKDKHKRVDDKIYGGGAGQLLMAEPILKAYEYALTNYAYKNKKHITVIMSASGKLLNSNTAEDLSGYNHIIIICGRYEGIDARVTDITDGVEISIGNYILSGGEIAAVVLIETVGRYFKGFLGNPDSLKEESLSGDLGKILEYPQYTKPKVLNGKPVPDILLGGNHKLINEWRAEKALKKTAENRSAAIDENGGNAE